MEYPADSGTFQTPETPAGWINEGSPWLRPTATRRCGLVNPEPQADEQDAPVGD